MNRPKLETTITAPVELHVLLDGHGLVAVFTSAEKLAQHVEAIDPFLRERTLSARYVLEGIAK